MEETAGKGGGVGCYQLESVSHTHVSTFTRSLSGTGCDNWQRDTNIRVRPRGEQMQSGRVKRSTYLPS